MSELRENSALEWDKYWQGKNTGPKEKAGLYDKIASFYRTYLIRPTLSHYICKHLADGSMLIHAGCGSGEVDTDLVQRMNIIAVDFSSEALECYRSNHPSVSRVEQCSIMEMPFENDSVDGIYNLGVMEHFSEDQIRDVLREFQRILKPGGKVVLLWPPVFGFSVIALHIIHFIMKWVFRNPDRLHPDEPSKVKSRSHAFGLLRDARFQPVEFGFGLRDFCTYAIIVGQKQ